MKKRLLEQTSSQVDKFQRRIRFPRRGRRLTPEELKQRAEKYVNYQTQVKTIQQAVKELLAKTGAGVTEEQAYLNYARMVLSAAQRGRTPGRALREMSDPLGTEPTAETGRGLRRATRA